MSFQKKISRRVPGSLLSPAHRRKARQNMLGMQITRLESRNAHATGLKNSIELPKWMHGTVMRSCEAELKRRMVFDSNLRKEILGLSEKMTGLAKQQVGIWGKEDLYRKLGHRANRKQTMRHNLGKKRRKTKKIERKTGAILAELEKIKRQQGWQ